MDRSEAAHCASGVRAGAGGQGAPSRATCSSASQACRSGRQPVQLPRDRAEPFRRTSGDRHEYGLAADVAGSRLRIDDPQHGSDADARARTTSKRHRLPNGMTGHPSGLAKQNPTMVRNQSPRRALKAPNRKRPRCPVAGYAPPTKFIAAKHPNPIGVGSPRAASVG